MIMNTRDKNFRGDEKIRLLIEVSQRIASILNVDELMVQVVQLIQKTFGYYHVGIGLIEGDEVVYRVGSGKLWDSPDFQFKPGRLKIGKEGITGWVASTGEVAVIPNVDLDDRYVWMVDSETRSELTVPILIKGNLVGVLDVQSDQLNDFHDSDVELMMALASQTGIAIENARLYEDARKMAAFDERQRLARDLHDSVSQSLYGVTLYAEVAGQLLASGEIEKTRQNLSELKEMAMDAMAEMRLLIYELRPSVFTEEGLVAAIQTRLDAVEGRVGLKTSFSVEGNISLEPKTEENLYRITQEALHNILKHARAKKASILLTQDEHSIYLEIADDGIGFDPIKCQDLGCVGLSSMKERAQEIGADLEINSQEGSGSRIIVRRTIS
jgi:signal transduction histidine kinase